MARLTTAQRLEALEAESARTRAELDTVRDALRLTVDAGYASGRQSIIGPVAAAVPDRAVRGLARGSHLRAVPGGAL